MDLQSQPVFAWENTEILIDLDIPWQPLVGLFNDPGGRPDFFFNLLICDGSYHGFIPFFIRL